MSSNEGLPPKESVKNNSPEHENIMENLENKKKIIESIFSESLPTPDDLEKKYPPRELEEGAMVTRIAPSPTGFMHIGGLYTALISERFAHQTDGLFYLRIEDTDRKREVQGASELISESLDRYNIKIDEGQNISGDEFGAYGPYKQSERKEIYKTFIKSLLERDLAYPCFDTQEDLDRVHEQQKELDVRPGYYKQWARWRDKSTKEVLQALEEGRPYVIRFRSSGDFNNKVSVQDVLKGNRELSENDQDVVIMKSDGLPTYHLAHVVDDHLMRTTHVIRGDEWLSSLLLHLQLFKSMGWQPPQYGHVAPIQKLEGSSKRKLSKRKDPEANVGYYDEHGYPEDAVIEYLLNLANSDFEDWRKANPNRDVHEFSLTFEKLSNSNAPLFDFVKLDNISKEVIARYSAEDVYSKGLGWAKKHDTEFAQTLQQDPDYSKKVLDIDRGTEKTARKDLSKWSEMKKEMEYFFDESFHVGTEDISRKLPEFGVGDIKKIVESFIVEYDEKDSKDQWFDKIKKIARKNGYAESTKEFKRDPNSYKGTVAEIAKVFRVLVTGRVQTPDLYSLMQVMGKDRVFKRLSIAEQI